jgi:hypothetical protein
MSKPKGGACWLRVFWVKPLTFAVFRSWFAILQVLLRLTKPWNHDNQESTIETQSFLLSTKLFIRFLYKEPPLTSWPHNTKNVGFFKVGSQTLLVDHKIHEMLFWCP